MSSFFFFGMKQSNLHAKPNSFARTFPCQASVSSDTWPTGWSSCGFLAFPGVEEGSPPLEQGKGPNEKNVLFFLPLLVLVWRAVAIVHKPALGPVLLGASILFCFWASPAALLILGLMILVNYGLGLALAAPGEREGSLRRKGLLFLALVLNFTPLLLVRYLPRLGLLFPSMSGVEREIPFWSTLWEGMAASGPEACRHLLLDTGPGCMAHLHLQAPP